VIDGVDHFGARIGRAYVQCLYLLGYVQDTSAILRTARPRGNNIEEITAAHIVHRMDPINGVFHGTSSLPQRRHTSENSNRFNIFAPLALRFCERGGSFRPLLNKGPVIIANVAGQLEPIAEYCGTSARNG
jgi:hypothetical protein